MPAISTTIPTDIKIYKTIDEFDKNLPETVQILRTANGSKVYLIGTSHYSIKSQTDVSIVMQNVKPDMLVLELCPKRLHILDYNEEHLLKEAANLNFTKMFEIIRMHGLMHGLFYIKFLNINAGITKQLGISPGGECRRAVAEAKQLKNCHVFLGDRPINITMQRAVAALTPLDKLNLFLFSILNRPGKIGKITQADVEDLRNDKEMPSLSPTKIPSFYNVFVRERDILLSHSLQFAAQRKRDANGNVVPVNVVGVVGIGHSQGIQRNWGHISAEQIKDLLIVPPKKHVPLRYIRMVGVKYGLFTLCGYGCYKMWVSKRNDK